MLRTQPMITAIPRDVHPSVYFRKQIEYQIAKAFVTRTIESGYNISVDDGENETRPFKRARSVLRAMFTVDIEHLRVWKDRKRIGWALFVYGNEGFDVISDHTTNLNDLNLMSEADRVAQAFHKNMFEVRLCKE